MLENKEIKKPAKRIKALLIRSLKRKQLTKIL
jgi:hypothetical protein